MNDKLLSILIPTYNRYIFLDKLLSFLNDELSKTNFYHEIEILVSNNCSTDETEKVILSSNLYVSKSIKFIYLQNNKNIGPVNNIIILYKESKGEYVWLMGDDDIYYKGIIKRIYVELKKGIYSYVFINHCTYHNYKGDGTGKNSVIGDVSISSEKKDILLDIFEYSGSSLMFISAAIHKKATIIDLLNKNVKINLAFPLFLSFYSASMGKVKIIPEVMIENVQNGISWKDQINQVFLCDIPYVLSKLVSMQYNKIRSYKILIKYLWKRKKNIAKFKLLKSITLNSLLSKHS